MQQRNAAILVTLLGAMLLLIPAFYNGYPLMNPDTGTYLASGFKPETPFDRPITYGLLIRLLSLNGASLWLFVYAQAAFTAWLLMKVVQRTTGDTLHVPLTLFVIAFLSVCTSLSWLVSQVEPDLYTAMACLCATLILLNKENKSMTIVLYVFFFICVAIHLSHPLIFCLLLVLLFLLKPVYAPKETYKRINTQLCVLVLLTLSSIAIMGSAYSKSKHIFFAATLVHKKLFKAYLDEQCPVKNFSICLYKDEIPENPDEFMWNENGPLSKAGGWGAVKADFNEIAHDILTKPQYLSKFANAAIRQSALQAMTFNIGDGNFRFAPGSNVNNRVREYFPQEAGRFDRSKQNEQLLSTPFRTANILFTFIIIFSIVTIIMLLVRSKPTYVVRSLLILCLSAIIINIVDCGSFGVTNGRYGAKMIWLIPFCATVMALSQKRSRQPPLP